MSGRVMYCHNPECPRTRDLDGGILRHEERETGALVPDWCPTCREDLYDEPLEDTEDEA